MGPSIITKLDVTEEKDNLLCLYVSLINTWHFRDNFETLLHETQWNK